jgi:hypothetical protein
MADATYQPKVYHKQGGDEFVVAASGQLTVESSGELEVESGGLLEVNSGGTLEVESGGKFTVPAALVSTATTSTGIPASGISVLKSTKTVKTLTLATPVAGEHKVLYALNASATGYVQVYSGNSGRTFDGTNTIFQFKKAGERVMLDAYTTARWLLTYASVADGTAINYATT